MRVSPSPSSARHECLAATRTVARVCTAVALSVVIMIGMIGSMVACSNPPTHQKKSDRVDESDTTDEGISSLGPSAACYVCHMTFVGESLSKTHQNSGQGCIGCHGLSKGHANDEDIGATPPDRVFDRGEINGFCRTCHQMHDVPPEQVVAQWLRRVEEKSIKTTVGVDAVCTDCHGNHTIDGQYTASQ